MPLPDPAEVYESFHVPAIFAPSAALLLEHARPQAGERVVDVGCGTGIVALRVAPLVGDGGQVVAVDVNPGMLAVARSLPAPDGASIEWREGSASALPVSDAGFDLVTCQHGVQFFPDPFTALREMRRVLGSGGRAVISVWRDLEHNPVERALRNAVAGAHPEMARRFDTASALGDAAGLQTLGEAAGFGKVQVTASVINARYASAERFLELTLQEAYEGELGAGANEDEFATLLGLVRRDIDESLRPYWYGDGLVFPKGILHAVART